MDIGVVGGSEFTLGFMLAGIKKIFTLETSKEETKEAAKIEAEKIIENLLSQKETGIIIIDDHFLQALDERMREKVERSVRPVFVPVSTEASQETLRKMIIKSIGVDLMRE